MAMAGSLLLAVAWLALNASVSLAASDGRIFVVAVNSALAAAGGALAASLHLSFVYGKSDPTLICNGMLAGLVAIAAPCAFVQPWAAFLIGAIAGVLAIWFIFFLEQRGIDDPAGVISVHGVNGLWGTLALGLFADGTFGHGYNGVITTTASSTVGGVAGLFYGDGKQLLCQCVMTLVCFCWSFIAGAIAFQAIGRIFGPNRVSREVELAGLDIPEVGVPAYPEFFNPMPSGAGFVAEPRPATSPTLAGQRRFSVVIEGVDPTSLIDAWSSLCQIGSEPPPAEFTEVYPFVTTVTGNRFRFSGGDPAKIKENLARLFQTLLADKPISAKIET
jgi:Amt family ammonium transporter